MTKIDRYIFALFGRTIVICFCSLGGVFVVFHAFNHLDDLAKQSQSDGSMAITLANYYGPYLLMLFDWTGSIITLVAMLFTVGWLRRSGELTALLAAGINHGRILRPMMALTLVVVLLQLANRELLIPKYRDILTTKPGELRSEEAQAMLPSYDRAAGILIEGAGLVAGDTMIQSPTFRLHASYPGYGDIISGDKAIWREPADGMLSGYLISGVTRPKNIDTLPPGAPTILDRPSDVVERASAEDEHSVSPSPHSRNEKSRPVLFSRRDVSWLRSGECFVATTVNPEVLRDNPRSTRMTGMPELVRRVRNSSVHSSDALRVMLHERLLRAPLDICMVLLGLPLVVNRGDKRLFGVVAQAMGIVLAFFGLKTVASGMGGSGYLLSPSMAAWLPLLILGPFAFVRYRDVQLE